MSLIISTGGDGATIHKYNDSHSVIILNKEYPHGRAATTGHEIFGHGRSWSAGYKESHQHEEAIRTENLILRVMDIPYVRDGHDHGDGTIIQQPSLLPAFR